jgi:hypothetical protein
VVEVHRLAVAGGEAGIARDVGGQLGRVWLARSRFGDVVGVASATLSLGPDSGASHHLGWAKHVLGYPAEALVHYRDALTGYRANNDRGNEAATLNNIGEVHRGLGATRPPWTTTTKPSPSVARSATEPAKPPPSTTGSSHLSLLSVGVEAGGVVVRAEWWQPPRWVVSLICYRLAASTHSSTKMVTNGRTSAYLLDNLTRSGCWALSGTWRRRSRDPGRRCP